MKLPELSNIEEWIKNILEAAAAAVAKAQKNLPEGVQLSEARINAVLTDVLAAAGIGGLVNAVKADLVQGFLTGKLPVRKGRGSSLAG